MTRYVCLYCRLSPRPDGSYEGVEAQERWGRSYAAQHWPDLPVEVFADAGISAAKDDRRPEYDRLRAWIRDGRVAHLWAVEQTRLERREVPWFELAAELDAAGITKLHTNRDGVVRVHDEVSGIKAVLAASEVRKLTRRVRDSLAEKARNGEPSGARPYGYRRTTTAEGVKTLEIVPEQAAIIREAADRVLSGWSLGAIAADLAARGLTAPHGGKMIGEAIRRMLVNAAAAGKRQHGERIYPGNWPAILDDDTWHAVRGRLGASRTVRQSDGGTFVIGERHRRRERVGRKYALTGGLTVCGVCDAPLYGSIKQPPLRKGESPDNRRPGVPYLLCHSTRGGRGCVGVQLEPVEAHVASRLFAELDKPDFLAALAADDHAEQRDRLARALSALDAQRADLAIMWAGNDMSTVEWKAARGVLDVRENDLRTELAALPAPPARLAGIKGAREAWPAMTLDEQRELLRMFIERITVHRAKPGAKQFDPERVQITWRTL